MPPSRVRWLLSARMLSPEQHVQLGGLPEDNKPNPQEPVGIRQVRTGKGKMSQTRDSLGKGQVG